MTQSRPTVGQIHITVTDLDRSVAFYRDVLGLEHLFTVPGQPMAFFDAGGVRLYLGRTEDERFVSRPTQRVDRGRVELVGDAVAAAAQTGGQRRGIGPVGHAKNLTS